MIKSTIAAVSALILLLPLWAKHDILPDKSKGREYTFQSLPLWRGQGEDQLRQKIRHIYTSQIGVREKGNNAGKQVESYLSYVKLAKGNPWCAAFVCWVFGQAGIENPKTGWSPALFEPGKVIWSKNSCRLPVASCPGDVVTGIRMTEHYFPTTGDVFGLYFPEKGRIAHVGFIDEWDDNWAVTVEGNTNISGGREGDGVYRKKRLVKSIYKVARYVTVIKRT